MKKKEYVKVFCCDCRFYHPFKNIFKKGAWTDCYETVIYDDPIHPMAKHLEVRNPEIENMENNCKNFRPKDSLKFKYETAAYDPTEEAWFKVDNQKQVP